MTGGRIKRIQPYIENETFMMTYGDGVADINIGALINFHKDHGKIGSITAVQPIGRFGALRFRDKEKVQAFQEKPEGDGAWINGGFFVLEPKIFDYIDGDSTFFEHEPLETIAKTDNLIAYKHKGFWQPMDTLRDKNYLEDLWASNKAPWKAW